MSINHRDLWDTEHLKFALAAHALSERKTFLYFLAIFAFDWMQFTAIRLSPALDSIASWERADALFTLALTLGGLVYLFICNGGARGRDFLYRYFPLSVVVGWKFLGAAVLMLWATTWLLRDAQASIVGWASTGVLAIINLLMFLRIGKHMRDLAAVSPRMRRELS